MRIGKQQQNSERMADRADTDQTAPVGAVWSGSTLSADLFMVSIICYCKIFKLRFIVFCILSK